MEEINIQQNGVPSDGASQSQQQPEHITGDLEFEGQQQGKTLEVEGKLESNKQDMISEKEQCQVQQQNTQQTLGESGKEGQRKQKEMNEIMPKKQKTLQGNQEVTCTLKGEIPKGEEQKKPPRKQNQNAEMQQQKQTKKAERPSVRKPRTDQLPRAGLKSSCNNASLRV